MTCLERLSAYLRDNCVSYTTHHHPTAYTASAVAAYEHAPPHTFAKVVMAFIDGALAMLVVPADTRADLARLAEIIGAREIRLADEREFAPAFPDCEPGAMPPFGNLYNIPVYLDRDLAECETIMVQAGTHQDAISMRSADFIRLVHPFIAPFERDTHMLAGHF
ncbi:MAG: YbaK/EbsC family protein [Roseiflexus sp.]|nr:YbaK/EbsC family protein [Roseiflexus sp.]MCS7290460.1 YbaK/EbsC family protein [Roseiflexus sp.]MDW8147633.1 YbaK/EbsC family protein [Roseiflexaceae bacterium]MDW8231524.1 YbaK/EbsC family protein [Roseiflexaceae bacterium]